MISSKEITYDFIIDAVKNWHKSQFGRINNLKDLFLLDILKSIENLMRNQPLPPESLKYISDNRTGIISLNKILKSYYEAILEKTETLSRSLDEYNFYKKKSIWKQDWIKEKLENLVHLKVEYGTNELQTFEIKLRITPNSWRFELWETDKLGKGVRQMIKKESVTDYERTKEKNTREFILVKSYPFGIEIDKLALEVYEFVEKIKKYGS
jgi:hypothetical protein